MGPTFSYVIYNFTMLPDVQKQKQELEIQPATTRFKA